MESGSEAVRVLEKGEEQKGMHALGAYTSKAFANKGLPCAVQGCSDRTERDMNIHAL